jgi:hypothetical protein
MLLCDVDSFNQHALIVVYSQNSAATAFVLAGCHYDFVAFSDLVHFVSVIARRGVSIFARWGGLLQHLRCK